MEEISTIEQWTALRAMSPRRPVIILKHSMTCPVSIAMFYRVEEAEQKGRYAVPIHMVVMQRSRDLARQIGADLGVEHATPQVIVVHGNRAVYQAGHFEIDPDALARALQALPPPEPLPVIVVPPDDAPPPPAPAMRTAPVTPAASAPPPAPPAPPPAPVKTVSPPPAPPAPPAGGPAPEA
ncbi:MAG: bacillithiol system redox-active protein YtxJ [Planctomycetota bacterium]